MTHLLEHWKPIVGFDGSYLISNTGRVWSCKSRKAITPYENGGYWRICLYRQNRQYHRYIHGLVAEAFLGAKPGGYTVNHKNGWKANNWASNFEYMTSVENTKHAVQMGLSNRGTRHGLAKLTEDGVRLMRNNPSARTPMEWAKHFGCHVSNIQRAISGESWRHI